MYNQNYEQNKLRQGDVVSGVFMPRIKVSSSRYLYGLSEEDSYAFRNQGVYDVEDCKAVIISQCCEFNPGKRFSFSLCSLLPFNTFKKQNIVKCWGLNLVELVPYARSAFKGRDEVSLSLLRESNVIGDEEVNYAVNAFLFEADGICLHEPHVADFSRVASFSIKDLEFFKKRKRLELTNESRRNFQLKLAYFYGRSAVD